MRELTSSVEIGASARRVWDILTDFGSYPDWNPFITSASGEAERGATLEIRIEPPEGRAMTFKPRVLEATPERELRWLGRLFLPGVFDGEHSLRIEPIADERVRFVQSERFDGILV